jgi:hypothetical protein
LVNDQPIQYNATYKPVCFKQFDGILFDLDEKGFKIKIKLGNVKSLFCSDLFIFATSERFLIHNFFFKGEHEIIVKDGWKSKHEFEDVKKYGLRTFNLEGFFFLFLF